MVSPRWRKVLREMWSNKMRTLLVVASIAVGIFAVGTVQQLRSVILGELQAIYLTSAAPQASIFTSGVSEEALDAIRRMPGVADAEGRSSLGLTIEVAPDQWESFNVTGVNDFDEIRVGKLEPVYTVEDQPGFGAERTTWPGLEQFVLERGSLQASDALPAGLVVGDKIRVETPDGKRRSLELTGLVYDANGFPAAFTGTASGYVTMDTLERLGGSGMYGQVNLRVAGTPEQLGDKEYITGIANTVADKIEKSGQVVQRVDVPDPGRLPLQDLFDALALLLTPLGLLALFLSGFLVVNTISALMAQQTRQIGIMKAVGARRNQIVWLYLGMVLLYSLLAVAVALPLTVVTTGGIAQFLGGFINVSFPFLTLPVNVLVIELSIGILVPLLAALYPVFKGTSVTVREAVSDYGVGGGAPQAGRFALFISSVRGMSRPLQLSLRNTFRRRARLALTLITLVMGGMLFMTVGSVRTSLDNLITVALDYYQYDVQLNFERPYRAVVVEQIVRSAPGVGLVESWFSTQATRERADGTEGDPLTVFALPTNSQMVDPTLQAGRWLVPEDENAIVISQKVLANEPDIQVGDEIKLELDGTTGPWRVVGIAQVLGGPPDVIPVYVNYGYFTRLTDNVGRATSVQLQLAEGAGLTGEEMATKMEEIFDAAGVRVAFVFTIERLRQFTGSFFDIIVYLLLTMGTLIAAVGALGLMGTMSTNVLERTREIGVMRAIGASDQSVLRIVIVEGVLIGVISWLIGGLLAFPVGLLLSTAVGRILFQSPLPYVFSANGVVTWFVIVVLLAGIASFLPAWNASRLTVREVLAYE